MEPLTTDDPREVGGFRLRCRLGSGGMGRVYLGYSPAGRAVAVKVVHPEFARNPEFIQRFAREVKAAEAVGGAYTAPVVAAGPDDDPPWLATVFVAGPSLADVVAEAGPLPEAAVWRLAGGLAEALQAVHTHGLVHRDLKPANVLLASDGPRVIDFGISQALDGTALTARSVVLGTPSFMSPEQGRQQKVGPASDVFSLGSVIVYAATGAAPFGGGEPLTTIYRIVHDAPNLSGLPAGLVGLVTSCLAKDPAARPTLGRLMEAVVAGRTAAAVNELAGRAPQSGNETASFWPEPVAGLVSSRQDRVRARVPSGAGSSGPAGTAETAGTEAPPARYEPTAVGVAVAPGHQVRSGRHAAADRYATTGLLATRGPGEAETTWTSGDGAAAGSPPEQMPGYWADWSYGVPPAPARRRGWLWALLVPGLVAVLGVSAVFALHGFGRPSPHGPAPSPTGQAAGPRRPAPSPKASRATSSGPSPMVMICTFPPDGCTGFRVDNMMSKPPTITITQNELTSVQNLTWTRYGSQTATGTGILEYYHCPRNPDCNFGGTYSAYQATVTLSGLEPYGHRILGYSRMVISAPLSPIPTTTFTRDLVP